MRPRVRRVMGMTETNRGNDLLGDLKQILLGPFPDFAGRQSRGGMRHEERAHTLAHFRALDDRLDALGEIDDFFEIRSVDPEHVSHTTFACQVLVIIDKQAVGRKGEGDCFTAADPAL